MLNKKTYNEKIEELVGNKGYCILKKAVLSLPNVNKENTEEYLEQMQIVPRGISYWLSKSLKNLKDSNVPIILKIPSMEYQLEIIKKEKDLFCGRLLKNEQTIAFIDNKDMPNVLATCLSLESTFNESVFNLDTNLNKSLQKTVNLLVNNNFFPEKKIEIKLNKTEDKYTCPDCQESIILNPEHKRLCICFKILGKNSLHIYKDNNENIKVLFSDKWSKENISLLLKALWNKKGEIE